MHGRSALRPPDAPGDRDDDPFADLLEPAELEQEEVVPGDDREHLRAFFADTTRPPHKAGRAPPGSPWPEHNFGAAYDSLRRQRPPRLLPRVLGESDVWDIDQITDPAARDAPEPVAAEPAPWRTASSADPADHWLDALEGDDVRPDATEARLVDLAWGRPLEATLLEATDVLHARPRAVAPLRTTSPFTATATARAVPRSVEVAALAVLLLFALAVLQLLLS